jgi:putative membrane protein
MSLQDFASDAARAETRLAIEDVERQTSAEIVVMVRRVAGRYRDADYLAGFALSVLTLLALLYLPQEFPLSAFPLDVVLTFGLGAVLSSRLSSVRRLFSTRAQRAENVRLAARAAFVDRGFSRLPGRHAVLVYVGLFERAAEVLPDVGVDVAGLAGWAEASRALDDAVSSRDLPAFLAALRRLGPILAPRLPRIAEDVNELADEPVAC